jgi:hypothetical protein
LKKQFRKEIYYEMDFSVSLSPNTTAMILLPEHSSHQLGGRQGETLMQ